LNDIVPATPRKEDEKVSLIESEDIFEEKDSSRSVQINQNKEFEQIMQLQCQVEEQFRKNRELIQFITKDTHDKKNISASQKPKSIHVSYPQIDQDTIYKVNSNLKRVPTNKKMSAGGQTRYANITQIFDPST